MACKSANSMGLIRNRTTGWKPVISFCAEEGWFSRSFDRASAGKRTWARHAAITPAVAESRSSASSMINTAPLLKRLDRAATAIPIDDPVAVVASIPDAASAARGRSDSRERPVILTTLSPRSLSRRTTESAIVVRPERRNPTRLTLIPSLM